MFHDFCGFVAHADDVNAVGEVGNVNADNGIVCGAERFHQFAEHVEWNIQISKTIRFPKKCRAVPWRSPTNCFNKTGTPY